ncbi:hypothetical protein Tco_0200802 [Tanacetum coccineum]
MFLRMNVLLCSQMTSSAKINEQGDITEQRQVENACEVVSGHILWRTTDTSTSIPYPPGFTPANDIPACNNQDIPEAESVRPPSRSARSNSRVLEEAENSMDRVSSESFRLWVKIKEGRFHHYWKILEEMITVGQTMGFSMEGLGSKAKKDWIKELISKHKLEGFSFHMGSSSATKMSKLDRFFVYGLLSDFPLISAICLDRHLSDQQHILLKGSFSDFGPYLHFVFITLGLSFLDSMTWSQNLRILLLLMIPMELEIPISNEDIRPVWGCGVDKSPGPDGFTFEFFRKYWTVVGPDFCIAVKWFFDHGDFAIGCNSSFVALIPKVLDPKVVSDYRPISLIGSCTKSLLRSSFSVSLVISDLISDFQTAFLPNRQILDGLLYSSDIFSLNAPFKYLGILVGDNMSSKKAWDETINKMKKRLSRWKLNTLSVGGRLTLLKSVLGSTHIYNMLIFKVPKSVLNYMESLRRNFFNGFQEGDRKIAWVKWSKVLAF